MVPTLSRLGTAEPLGTPAALRSSSAAGGVLSTKLNERSSKTVISTGMMVPACAAVRSLYCLTNSMTLRCGATAGPTGGAGVALAAPICSLITVLTFLAKGFLLLSGSRRPYSVRERLVDGGDESPDYICFGYCRPK